MANKKNKNKIHFFIFKKVSFALGNLAKSLEFFLIYCPPIQLFYLFKNQSFTSFLSGCYFYYHWNWCAWKVALIFLSKFFNDIECIT